VEIPAGEFSMRGLLSVCLFLFCLVARAEVSAIYGKYFPTGSVSSQNPVVSWNVKPTGGGTVSRVEMSINNKPVVADFNTESNSVEYSPSKPLQDGLYTVACRVTIARELIVRQDWSFEVNGGEPSDRGPASSFAAAYAFEATNAIRAEMGMPPFLIDDRISAAAAAHSRYQLLNRGTGHYEVAGKPGFTGVAPWDRIQKFGYPGVCYEGACGHEMDPRRAIRLLFDAPYHRIAFLQPGSPPIGIGFEAGALTVDYAVSTEEGVGMSPAPGQRGVPTAWDGNESPCPLRIHGASGAVGYPIVFSWFSPRIESISISSMKLISPAGSPVPAYVNTPENDAELRFAGVITPMAKLRANTCYTVRVQATTQRGVKINRTWSFTTGP
jgi:uncharacterized protein YkwD